MSAQKDKLAEIFDEAVELQTPGERAAFLNTACGQDAELRAEVEQLLNHDDAAGGFLESAAVAPADADEPIAEGPGDEIGPYKLLKEIGEGAFGVVFMAEQNQPVRREVALKILKPGMDTRQVVARFDAERQALALMDHTNIARVLDAGATGTGRPYFVMELVAGVPITRYCDDLQLSVRDRLELFIPVCRAIQHAHQKGIIHRDIKPSNVLVSIQDGRPLPKVIDFGVAKALHQSLTEWTLSTEIGTVIGTLEYMSPEQAELSPLGVDTRTDVYALGVLLYELLTGTTPLEKQRLRDAPYSEIVRLIREEEPPSPSTRLSALGRSGLPSRTGPARQAGAAPVATNLGTIATQRQSDPKRLRQLMRGELDWIVMKALEKDRTGRYEGADALARDIERYLHDEPVEACPPSRAYRLQKFIRKNRGLIGTAAAFVLLLATGAGVSAWQAVRARSAERDALAARDREAEQLQQAKRSEARAQAVLKFFEDKVLAAARPKGQEGGLGKDATIKAALDQAEPEIAKSFAKDPLIEASIRNTLGVSYWYLSDLDQARRQQEKALELRRRQLGPDHVETIGLMNDIGIILYSQGKRREAEKLFAETVEAKRRALGPEHPSTLRSANNLAVMLAEQGSYEEACKLAQETWKIQQRVEGPEKIFTLRSAYNVAIMWRCQGQVEDARKLFEETLETLRRVFGSEHQDTLRVMNYLAELMADQGELAKAQALFEQTLEAQRRVLGPKNDETIMAMANLADAYRAQNQLRKATKLAEEAAELHRTVLGPNHPQTCAALTILANVYRDDGRFAEARKLYEETLARQRPILPKAWETQKLMNSFAWMLATAADSKFRDPPRAVELAKEVVEHAPMFADRWTTLGVARYRVGDWRMAIAALEKSQSLSSGHFSAANGFFLAMAHWQLGEREKAREHYAKAFEWMDKSTKRDDPQMARFLSEAVQLLGLANSRDRPR